MRPSTTGSSNVAEKPYAIDRDPQHRTFSPTKNMIVFCGAREDPFFFDLDQFFTIFPDQRHAAHRNAGCEPQRAAGDDVQARPWARRNESGGRLPFRPPVQRAIDRRRVAEERAYSIRGHPHEKVTIAPLALVSLCVAGCGGSSSSTSSPVVHTSVVRALGDDEHSDWQRQATPKSTGLPGRRSTKCLQLSPTIGMRSTTRTLLRTTRTSW